MFQKNEFIPRVALQLPYQSSATALNIVPLLLCSVSLCRCLCPVMYVVASMGMYYMYDDQMDVGNAKLTPCAV